MCRLLVFAVEKERKKAEKVKKLAEKQAKFMAIAPPAAQKVKEKKKPNAPSEATLPPYVEDTPAGEKKSRCGATLRPKLA